MQSLGDEWLRCHLLEQKLVENRLIVIDKIAPSNGFQVVAFSAIPNCHRSGSGFYIASGDLAFHELVGIGNKDRIRSIVSFYILIIRSKHLSPH